MENDREEVSRLLGEVFYWLFNMSIAATLTGVCIILLRKLKKLPRRLIFFLWIIPFLRMYIPVGVGSKYGLMELLSKVMTKTVVVYEYQDIVTFSMMNSVMAANSYFPITYKVNLLEDVFRVASVIWIIVAAAFLIAFCILYGITKREMRSAVLLRDNIYLSEKIQSPAVYGIIRPRIILPAAYEDKDLTFVLLHENTHIRGADNLWRVIAFAAVAVHWFNPFAWLFLKCFLADMELSCDEKVLNRCGGEQKKAYASSLVDCIEIKNVFASAFGGAKIRVRIDSILSYKKMSAFSAFCFIALAITMVYVLLTNAL